MWSLRVKPMHDVRAWVRSRKAVVILQPEAVKARAANRSTAVGPGQIFPLAPSLGRLCQHVGKQCKLTENRSRSEPEHRSCVPSLSGRRWTRTVSTVAKASRLAPVQLCNEHIPMRGDIVTGVGPGQVGEAKGSER